MTPEPQVAKAMLAPEQEIIFKASFSENNNIGQKNKVSDLSACNLITILQFLISLFCTVEPTKFLLCLRLISFA